MNDGIIDHDQLVQLNIKINFLNTIIQKYDKKINKIFHENRCVLMQGDDPLLTIIDPNTKISSDRVINNFVLPTGEGPYAGGLFAPDST